MGYGGKKGGKGSWGDWGMDPMSMMMSMMMSKGMGKGGGWGKGGAKGSGKGSGKGPKNTVKKDFEVDSERRYTGTVAKYSKFSGYGFIEMNDKDVVPKNMVYVYWKALDTEDRYPMLTPELEVEFSLTKRKDRDSGKYSVRASRVTLLGGGKIELQSTIDAEKKTFVGGQHQRFTGNLKFFDKRKGFGYITMNAANTFGETVPEQLRVELSEVNAGGRHPGNMKDLNVEFGIWKTKKDVYKAYNMTLSGGEPVSQENLEHRTIPKSCKNKNFTGTVAVWDGRKGWGMIKFDSKLPADVMKMVTEQTEAAKEKKGNKVGDDVLMYFRRVDIRSGERISQKGTAVEFQIYTDDKGAGACDVHAK